MQHQEGAQTERKPVLVKYLIYCLPQEISFDEFLLFLNYQYGKEATVGITLSLDQPRLLMPSMLINLDLSRAGSELVQALASQDVNIDGSVVFSEIYLGPTTLTQIAQNFYDRIVYVKGFSRQENPTQILRLLQGISEEAISIFIPKNALAQSLYFGYLLCRTSKGPSLFVQARKTKFADRKIKFWLLNQQRIDKVLISIPVSVTPTSNFNRKPKEPRGQGCRFITKVLSSRASLMRTKKEFHPGKPRGRILGRMHERMAMVRAVNQRREEEEAQDSQALQIGFYPKSTGNPIFSNIRFNVGSLKK